MADVAKKAAKKRAGGSASTRVGTPTVVTELVGGTDLAVLGRVLSERPGQRLLHIADGLVDGGGGWLVVWEA